MKVLYVSKAMTVAAYRDKLRELAKRIELSAVVPERWGSRTADASDSTEPWLRTARARLHGHNHFHTYRRPAAWIGQPDLVHIDEEPYSAVTAQIARQCERRGVPFVFFAWQNIAKRIPQPFALLRRHVFETARGGIAGTDDAAAVLRAWGYRGPLATIPQMGIDPQRFRCDAVARATVRSRIGAGENDFVIGFAGRLVTEKGVHLLLQAGARIENSRLVFIGDGPERDRLRAGAERLGVSNRLHIEAAVDSRAMPEWLNALDVLVLPSMRTRRWMEQFGRVLVEAMACGVAVVGSDSGEIPRVVGDAGLIFAEGDADALRAALVALRPAERRAEAGARGRCRVERMYTNGRIADDTVAFYERVLEGETA